MKYRLPSSVGNTVHPVPGRPGHSPSRRPPPVAAANTVPPTAVRRQSTGAGNRGTRGCSLPRGKQGPTSDAALPASGWDFTDAQPTVANAEGLAAPARPRPPRHRRHCFPSQDYRSITRRNGPDAVVMGPLAPPQIRYRDAVGKRHGLAVHHCSVTLSLQRRPSVRPSVVATRYNILGAPSGGWSRACSAGHAIRFRAAWRGSSGHRGRAGAGRTVGQAFTVLSLSPVSS